MIKTDEDRRNEILAFARLKTDKQVETTEGLKAKIKASDDQIILNKKQIEAAENDLKKLEQEFTLAKNQYSEARDKRKKLFALGKDTKDLDAEIWRLKLDLENREALLTDSIDGLKNRISDFQREITFLEEERNEAERMILQFEVVPLIPKFNQKIAEAMKTFEQIYENQSRLNYTIQSTGSSRFTMLYLSDWEWLEKVGKMYFVGDIADEDRLPFGRSRGAWSLREFLERRMKKEKSE